MKKKINIFFSVLILMLFHVCNSSDNQTEKLLKGIKESNRESALGSIINGADVNFHNGLIQITFQ